MVMKKTVKIIIHLCFWAYFPLASAFSIWSMQNAFKQNIFNNSTKDFFEILYFVVFQKLFITFDAGRATLDLSNVIGITFNIFYKVLLPLGVFYIFYCSIIPNYIKNRNLKKMLIFSLIALLTPGIITFIFGQFTLAVSGEYMLYLTLIYISTIQFTILGTLFRTTEFWINRELTEKQNLKSELSVLKHQINPHFLFNTLNNIDSLIIKNQAKASEILLKLSHLLRYLIYDTNKERVLLTQEIDHIKEYIDLQLIQHSNQELISFSIKGEISSIQIAPLLLLPFVENAFKHCNQKNFPNAIKIDISLTDKILTFSCKNLHKKKLIISKDKSSGTGLINVYRRLELIYLDKHTLEILDLDEVYEVNLSINTNEN